MKDNKVHITLYRWAGRKLFWEIGGECEECDRSVFVIRQLLETNFRQAPVTFEVKNWLDHLFESLAHWGWHAPVIVVNGKRFSQGVTPKLDRLEQRIRKALAETHSRCPICGNIVFGEDYSSHRKEETRRRVIQLIQAQHPEWVGADGMCLQCLAFYQQQLERGELVV